MVSAFEMANGSPDKNSNYILLAGKQMATFAGELFFFDSCCQLHIVKELIAYYDFILRGNGVISDSTFIILSSVVRLIATEEVEEESTTFSSSMLASRIRVIIIQHRKTRSDDSVVVLQ